MLVRLSLIEQNIKDANFMCLLFNVKHLQTFRESWMSLYNMSRTISNMYIFPELVINHKLKVMIRNQRTKGTFICGPLFFKWLRVFQSCFDCFSIGVWALIQNINFLIFSGLCMLVSICYKFLNALTCSLITLFFKCIKLHQILFLFSTIYHAYVLEINIFGRDYSNLYNFF